MTHVSMLIRTTITAAALLVVGSMFLLPKSVDATTIPKDQVLVGPYAYTKVVGTIQNISGTTLTVESWGLTFQASVTDTTKFYPTIRSTASTPTQRLSAYAVGDVVTLHGKMSPETYIVTATILTNHTERSSGSSNYQVKRAVQGVLTEVVPNTRIIVRENKTNTLYTLTINSDTKIYNKSLSRAGTDLAGWGAGNEVYAYALLSGTGGVATYIRNYTYGSSVSDSVNGSCGRANGSTFTSRPSTNLCTKGTASTVSGSGPWTWQCAGSNGGTTASCSAKLTNVTTDPPTPPPLNGICGTANGSTYTSKPISNLCAVGTASTVSGSGPWTWQCVGQTDGTTASCSAKLQSASAPTATFTASPISITSGKTSRLTWTSSGATSCLVTPSGASSNTTGSVTVSPSVTTTYKLACTGAGGSTVKTVTVSVASAPLPPTAVNGSCGTANGSTYSSKPISNLCAVGAASTVSGSGPWTWQCAGSNGGTTAACSAQLQSALPPPPPPPAMP